MTSLEVHGVRRAWLHSLAGLVLASAVSAASAQMKAVEMPGAVDHPLLSRYAGSVLHAASQPVFEQMVMPVGPGYVETQSGVEFKEKMLLDGTLSGYFYVAPKDRSALEVFRNYEQALKRGGFKVLFKCELQACDAMLLPTLMGKLQLVRPRWPKSYPSSAGGAFENDLRFIGAELNQAGQRTYVQVYVGEPKSTWEAPAVMHLVLETKPMDEGKVLVDSAALTKGLAADGKVALYGIYFDTGRAVLKPASQPQLREMAQLLAADTKLRVAIVGHTDTQGPVEANVQLSQQRAAAVVQALVREHGVSASRLSAKGVAAFAPVASNANEAGRAKNRRVEMVQQ